MFETLEKIEQETSNKKKQELLKKGDCAELREYLDIVLNPYRVYHVSKLPKSKPANSNSKVITGKGFTNFKNLINALEQREISGHSALSTIYDCFSTYTSREQKWFGRALTKKAIGVGLKTVNKAFRNLIPEFKVMLADSEMPVLTAITYPTLIQPKLDGFRAVFVPGMGFMGRNGKPIKNAKLNEYFAGLFEYNKDYVLDGELDCQGLLGQKDSFNKTASLLNSHDKDIPKEYKLRYTVYDAMPKSDWDSQSCKMPYEERLEIVSRVVYELMDYFDYDEEKIEKDKVTLIQSYSPVVEILSVLAYNAKQASKRYLEWLNFGYEGMMIKSPFGKYHWRRVPVSSQTMMKVKPEITHDIKIVGFEAGKPGTKYANTLGALVCDFKGKEVKVGSGLEDDERKLLWSNKSHFKGKFIEVTAMEVTADGSLRHPRFKRMREDK